MKKTVKKKWLKALRSGEYKQGKWQLQTPASEGTVASFCCLGVLCELAVAEGVIPPPKLNTENDKMYYGNGDGDTSTILPGAVIDWAFLKREVERGDKDNFRDPHAGAHHLSFVNDFGGKSFNQIADLIEEHL